RLETMLLEAERGQPRADMLDKLFRDIHSLKGNAGYLGYPIARDLAHAAEDLLSTLSEQKLAVTPHQCSTLLAAGDKLRQLVESIRATQEENKLDVAALIADLQTAAGLQETSATSHA